MKKTSFLWLLAAAALIILVVLVIRPPAWATPLARGAMPLETTGAAITNAPHQQPVVNSQAAATGASHIHTTLQADTPSSDNCIACHTDKKKLKAVAEEPEEVKSEKASGEG